MRVLRALLWLPRMLGRALLWLPGKLGRALLWLGRAIGRGVRRLVHWPGPAAGPEAAARRRRVAIGVTWVGAAGSTAIAFGTAPVSYRIDYGVAPFIGVGAGLPLALAVIRPLVGWSVSVGSAAAFVLLLPNDPDFPWPFGVMHGLVMLALLFAVAVQEPLRRTLGAWLITVALFVAAVPNELAAGWVVGVTVVAVTGVLIGRLARTSRALRVQEEVSSAEKARRMVLEERTRIARDLHDIVAHHMSLVVVQAETAPYRVPGLTDGARDELAAISSAARSALAETRALLNVLRQDDQQAEHAPQPGLERLDELIEAARRAGVSLDAEVQGPLDQLRPGTSLAAYRIVQEALANAARHAPGAPVWLRVVRDVAELRVEVANGQAPGRVAFGPVTEGHGITGMRERAGVEGGTLSIGPTPAGGFAVQVTLPVEPVDESPGPPGSPGSPDQPPDPPPAAPTTPTQPINGALS